MCHTLVDMKFLFKTSIIRICMILFCFCSTIFQQVLLHNVEEESHAEQGTIELETAKHFTCSRPSVRRLAATTSVTTSRGRGRSSRFWSGTTRTRGTIARWAPFNTKVIATKTPNRHTFIIAITFSTFFPVGQSMLGTFNQSFPQIPFVSRLQKNQISWNDIIYLAMQLYLHSTLHPRIEPLPPMLSEGMKAIKCCW